MNNYYRDILQNEEEKDHPSIKSYHEYVKKGIFD